MTHVTGRCFLSDPEKKPDKKEKRPVFHSHLELTVMGSHPPSPTASQQPDDDFLEHLFSLSPYSSAGVDAAALDASSVNSTSFPSRFGADQLCAAATVPQFPLAVGRDSNPDGNPERDHVQFAGFLPPGFQNMQQHQVRPNPPPPAPVFHSQPKQARASSVAVLQQPPAPRPKVRARRGQATDPHSIAERLRRERIAERMRALQELVPTTNKTDRAVMLDEILDYVKFLRLQVKVLSMSRLGGAGAVAQLVADVPLSIKGETSEGGSKHPTVERWPTEDTERQVAKLLEKDDIGEAMQFLQSKSLCMMPISLATAIYDSQPQLDDHSIKPEPNTPA